MGGGVGIGFMRLRFIMLDALTRAWQRLGVPIWARPGTGGLAVGAVLLILPEMYGESSATLNRALAGRYALTLLLVLCVAKMITTSLTLGMGFVGGVFAPALFIGGTLGAAFGTLVAPSYAPAAGVFGVIGMGAVFAGAARAPMTAVLLIIEMTGQHALLLPLMLATVLATFISRFLSRGTLFTEELRRRGEDVEDPMTTTLLGRTHASRLMADPPAVLEDTAQLNEAASLMSRRGVSALPVVTTGEDGARELLGCVTAAQLAGAILSDDSDDASPRPATVAELSLVCDRLPCEAEATDVLEALTSTRLEGLPVVARAAGSGAEGLVGWVSQRIVVERIYEVQAQARAASVTYTSWGSRLQDKWHSRPVPPRRTSRISSRSSRRSRRR